MEEGTPTATLNISNSPSTNLLGEDAAPPRVKKNNLQKSKVFENSVFSNVNSNLHCSLGNIFTDLCQQRDNYLQSITEIKWR